MAIQQTMGLLPPPSETCVKEETLMNSHLKLNAPNMLHTEQQTTYKDT